MPVNPVAGGFPAPDIAAIIAGELAALAADAQTLGARLSVGDVVEAVVLPSNGLADLLDIGGLRVAAELPPSLLPGDTISVAVTGFSGDRINLQIVSTSSNFGSASKAVTDARDVPTVPTASAPRRAAARPPRTAPDVAVSAERIRPANGLVSRSAPTAAGTPAPSARTPGSAAEAPVRAAEVLPLALGVIAPATGASAPAAEALARAAAAAEQTPEVPTPAPAQVPAAEAPVAVTGAPVPLAQAPGPAAATLSRAAATLARAAGALARAAAAPALVSEAPARAGAAPAAEPPAPGAETPVPVVAAPKSASEGPADRMPAAVGASGPASSSGPAPAPARLSQPMPSVVQPVEARLAAAHVLAATIARPPAELTENSGAKTAPNRSGQLPSTASAVVPPPVIGVRPSAPVAPPAPATGSAAALRGLARFAEPAAFLRALRLPVTAANVASARTALDPGRLPNALAALDRALANTTGPRVATLSTITGFLARLDPRSPVFATQIAAFVDHVVTGVEAKIAQLFRASDAAASAVERTIVAPAESREPPPPAAQSANPPPLAPQSVAIAHAALDFDLKTQLLALAADRETSAAATTTTPKAAAFNAAIAGALTAISALQLNAAAMLDAGPGGLSFTLPVALTDGVAQARVRIDPDTTDGKRTPLDGDNFHIAFVLETRHLGTVAIDVVTVGRTVSLSVKTEGVLAQRVFGTALGELTARLEKLRYRVTRADAVVAPPAEAPQSPSRPAPVEEPARRVDVNA